MPKGGRNLEKVLVVINYCSYVELLEVALYIKQGRQIGGGNGGRSQNRDGGREFDTLA